MRILGTTSGYEKITAGYVLALGFRRRRMGIGKDFEWTRIESGISNP
jgi:hypothetical protein